MLERPWMTALEMQFRAMRNCAEWRTARTRPSLPGPTEEWRPIVPLFMAAETYAWSRESVTAVRLASKTIPYDTRLDRTQLPSQAGWWWFDGGFDEDFVALLWGTTDEGQLACCCFVQIGTEIDQGFSFTWDYGHSVDSLCDNARSSRFEGDEPLPPDAVDTLADVARFFVAACAWLQQKVLTSSGGHIERHRRKQLAREHNAPVPSEVRVIQLRRAESQSYQPIVNGNEQIDWSCRWIVNGHWRNQPYKNERKLIYIMPYVKGPEDRPLKVPTHTVYQVSR